MLTAAGHLVRLPPARRAVPAALVAAVTAAAAAPPARATVDALAGPQRVFEEPGQLMTERMLWINGALVGPAYDAAALRVDAGPVRGAGVNAPNVAEIVSTANADSSNALSVTSTNARDSAVGVEGRETGKGTVKVTHTNAGATGADRDAAAVSLALGSSRGSRNRTAAQGIFLDAPAPGTTGKLLNLRNGGAERLTVGPQGEVTTAEVAGAPAAPAANRATIYTRDDGAGKTQLVVRFASGPPVVVATQP